MPFMPPNLLKRVFVYDQRHGAFCASRQVSSGRPDRLVLAPGSLFFLSVQSGRRERDDGVYWCHAENSEGAATSRNATLTVASEWWSTGWTSYVSLQLHILACQGIYIYRNHRQLVLAFKTSLALHLLHVSKEGYSPWDKTNQNSGRIDYIFLLTGQLSTRPAHRGKK